MRDDCYYLPKSRKDLSNVSMVVFEGPDCCGKTTQVSKFIEMVNKKTTNYDVVMKIHFPFKTEPTDDLKKNYKNLVKTIYSDEYMKSHLNVDELRSILTENIKCNSRDKMKFLLVLKHMLNGERFDIEYQLKGQPKLSIEDILKNPNCETFFNGVKLNVDNDEELKILNNYFTTTDSPRVLFVFDRFIISGIIYNLFLPKEIIKTYFDLEATDHPITDELNMIIHDMVDDQESAVYNELLGIHTMCSSDFLDITDNDPLHSYCDPKILWFVFKPSNIIYNAFLNDSSRKIEEYDSNKLLRETVNNIYNDIAEYGNTSLYLLKNKFNIKVIDTDELNNTKPENPSCGLKEIVADAIRLKWLLNNDYLENSERVMNEFLKRSYESL